MGSIVTTATPVLLQLGISDTATANEQSVVDSAIKWAESAVRRHLRYDPVYRTRVEYYPQMNVDYSPGYAIWEASETEAYLRQLSSAVTDELQLRHLPIRSITSLYLDYDGRFGKRSGSFATETLKTEGSDYWPRYDGVDDDSNPVCRDGIILSTGRWPTTPGSVKITYIAGYTADEFTGNGIALDAVSIYESVIFEAARKAKQTFMLSKNSGSGSSSTGWASGSIQSERLGDYSYTLGSSGGGSSSSGAGGLYDGVRDLSAETLERLADFVNLGFALMG